VFYGTARKNERLNGFSFFLLKTIKQRAPLLSNALFAVDDFLLLFAAISLGRPTRFIGLYLSNLDSTLLKGDGQSDRWFYPVGVISDAYKTTMPGPVESFVSEIILHARKFC
jgi:hypothetical protein